jgi:response regulator of citrate/malate metabolism
MLMRIKHGPVVLATRDSTVGAMVSAALASLGPQAPRLSSVSSMAECLSALRLLRPSVVLLDDAVTDKPGPQLIQELHKVQPGVHVVYIASRHSLDLEREMRCQGVLFYLARPMESESLESTLLHILQGLLRTGS